MKHLSHRDEVNLSHSGEGTEIHRNNHLKKELRWYTFAIWNRDTDK